MQFVFVVYERWYDDELKADNINIVCVCKNKKDAETQMMLLKGIKTEVSNHRIFVEEAPVLGAL